MEEFFKRYIAKKLHKKGEEYKLSENSKRSSNRFGESNTLTSKIYQAFKLVAGKLVKREMYNRLLKHLVEIKHLEAQLLKSETQYTVFTELRNFRLSSTRSWRSLLPWVPEIKLNLPQAHVDITLPDNKSWDLKSFPERLSRIGITFYVIGVSLDDLIAEQFFTETAFMVPHKPINFQRVKIMVKIPDECVLFVIGFVQYYLWDTSGSTDFSSNNKAHMAADIMQVFHVKNGELLCEKVSERVVSKQSVQKNGAKWE
ncbi:hypothetical protein FAZ19_02900 [Sphingobacterium alkalisoli]|uniref:Uncharacterized protein n=1 Tax=Sphingobacterium alkalisoli TaxID=1874115 RepID=A0A4V5LYX3_9SPHI|nr:hypothetical protein [Sphingobacterium alkalisoli]TJY68219.1 hypothetical protein FAZ19_02900 [Sphingobacterium alkalisoli]GGH08100.1 hypothetical protein GCM10011418_05510 [Sphingobacterium alkalisoli]